MPHATELKGNILWVNNCNKKKEKKKTDSFTVYEDFM